PAPPPHHTLSLHDALPIYRHAACHVLAEMVARTFDDHGGSRVAHAAPFSDAAGDEQTTPGCAIRNGVAREHGIDRAVTVRRPDEDRKSTRLNSSHDQISYA